MAVISKQYFQYRSSQVAGDISMDCGLQGKLPVGEDETMGCSVL